MIILESSSKSLLLLNLIKIGNKDGNQKSRPSLFPSFSLFEYVLDSFNFQRISLKIFIYWLYLNYLYYFTLFFFM